MTTFRVNSYRTFLAVVTFLTMMTVFQAGGAVAGDSQSLYVEWSLDAQLVVPDSEVVELGTRSAAANKVDTLISKLNARGAKTEKRIIGSDERGIVYGLKASGAGDVQSFRSLIHSVSKPQFNLLGGETEMEIESAAAGNGETRLILESNRSTGYAWHVAENSDMVLASAPAYEKHTLGYGVSERQIVSLAPGKAGTSIRLVYKRAWEDSLPTRQLKLKLSSLPATLNLSDPDAPAVPVTPPAGTVRAEAFPTVSAAELPSQFDWRTEGIVTPVRDQGGCGSCWAFGTVGIMESSLGKSGITGQDLSEQFLISCNNDGWDCGGGLTAHKYHYDTLGKSQSTIGAVLESVKPYTTSNGTCSGNYQKAYELTGWQFVTGSEWTIPTVDQIKSAIYTYGPITAGVCAGTGWDSYTSSSPVFSTNETAQCGGSTNHQIILVGWDDPGQYWILRNSWGTGWGKSGYMYIKYGTSRVGEGTSWVTTSSPVNYTLTVSKTGSGTVTSTPAGIDCGSTCSQAFSGGTTVVLAATGSPGFSFAGWSGACSGTGTCTVNMNSDKTVTATFAACPYTVTPESKTLTGYSAARFRVTITAPVGCSAPSVVPGETWIHASATSFNLKTAKGAVTISVDANSASSQARTGSVTIGDKTLSVSQAGKPCTITLDPVSSSRFSPTGSSGGFTVTTSLADCGWTAAAESTFASWLTNVSPGSGTGNGSVSYSVGDNPLSTARRGRIDVIYNGGKSKKVYTVIQSGQ